jgi:hypothetical protein
VALNKQIVPLVLDEGLNNKADDKVLPLGQFKQLINVRRTKNGLFQKRFGSTTLPTAISGGGSIESSQGLATFGNELLQFSENRAYSYAEGVGEWFDKGNVGLVNSSTSPIIRNSQQQTTADCANNTALNILVTAWEDTRGGVRAKVIDSSTGNPLVADEELNALGMRPKVLSVGIYAYVFYVVAATLRVRRYNRAVGGAFDTEISLAADVNASGFYDACVYSTDMAITWHTTANEIKVSFVSQAPALGTPILGYPTTATLAFAVTDSLTIWSQYASGLLYVAWFDAAVGLRATARKGVDLLQQFAPVTIDATLSPVVRNIGAVELTSASSAIFYEVTGQRVKYTSLSSTGTFDPPVLVRQGVGLVSKPWICDGQIFAMMAWESQLQSAYFAIRNDGFIVSKLLYGIGGGKSIRASHVPESTESSAGIFDVAGLQKNKIITEGNTTFTRSGVTLLSVDCSGGRKPQVFQLGENLHLLGGVVQSYDGVSFTETGFHIFPEGVTNPSNATTGGSLSDGVRQYAVLYEWIDAKGQIHRSAPSVPITITLAGGTSTQTTTLTLPTLQLTEKIAPRTEPIIAVYRTEDLGSIFYRVSSQTEAGGNNGLFLSDYTVSSISFVDALADSDIISREILYTTGDILENIAPNSCSAATVYKNRLVINSADGTGIAYYSKESFPGEGLAFSPFLTISADPENQPISAMGVLDDKLVLFKADDSYVTFGDGLNDAGQGQNFTIPERIATSTGCPFPDSVVRSQYGLFYKSKKGIKLLDRSLSEQDVGGAVKDYDSLTVSAAFLMTRDDEIRLTTEEGTTLVFNDDFKLWTVFTGQAAYDAAIWRGDYVRVASNGVVTKEDRTRFDDSGAHYSMAIETGWISFAGLQGFQRVYRLLLLGQYKSQHKLLIKIAKNFEPTWVEQFYWDPALAINQSTYGSGSPYGSESPYGGVLDSVYQMRAHLATQKCESIKFSIEDVNIGTAGESMSLTSLSFEVGLKGSAFKASQAKNGGSLG